MRRLAMALACLALLPACSASVTSEPTDPPATEFTHTTEDGQAVTCIHYDRGVSCNWEDAR